MHWCFWQDFSADADAQFEHANKYEFVFSSLSIVHSGGRRRDFGKRRELGRVHHPDRWAVGSILWRNSKLSHKQHACRSYSHWRCEVYKSLLKESAEQRVVEMKWERVGMVEGKKQKEMLIVKRESRNAREMEREGSLAVLRRQTEDRETTNGMWERGRESVCAFSLLSAVWRQLGRKLERCWTLLFEYFCFFLIYHFCPFL